MTLGTLAVYSQFDAQIAQYMFFNTTFNPAAAGEGDLMKVTGLHRMQFVGISNGPRTTYFQLQSPFVLGNTRHGAGIRFLNNKFGLFSNQALHLQYAYKYKLGNGYLSAGTELGFVSVGFQGDSVNLTDLEGLGSTYHTSSDEQIVNSAEEGMNFDMSLGIYYATEKWNAGISYSHVTSPKIHWGDYSTITLRGTMYITGGYNFTLRNRLFAIKPSFLVKTDFASWDCDLSALVEYKERFRGGVSVRIDDAVGILLGMDIISGLTIGYTYEIPTTKIILESSGSHELYLSYGFNILKNKRNSKYKSIRIL